MLRPLACVVLVSLFVVGCGEPVVPPRDSGPDVVVTDAGPMPVCIPGASVACACTDGRMGSQSCNMSGTGLDPCVCGGGGRCMGRACGPDGSGGSCGTCPTGQMCNALGTCDTVRCSGRVCGPDGAGGSCGMCPSGMACTDMLGICHVIICVPNCAGRVCGSDTMCGRSCGDCPPGQPCNPDGRCVVPPACIPIGDTCVEGSTCCTASSGPGACVTMPGLGTVCSAPCTTGAGCMSTCCVGSTMSGNRCAIRQWCPVAACTVGAFSTCRSADDACCNDIIGGANRPTSCTTIGSGTTAHAICSPLCISNADCDALTASTGAWACVSRVDHILVCAPI